MSIVTDYHTLDLDTEITLFTLTNFSTKAKKEEFNFCNHIGVFFAGKRFYPIPCTLEGLSYSGEGSSPRPKIKISDASTLLSSLLYLHDGVEGATLTIRKTLRQYIDGEPNANPLAIASTDQYVISQIISLVSGKYIELELSSPFDFTDETLPRRLCTRNCNVEYRGTECGYNKAQYFTIDGRKTLNKALDQCGKTVDDCQLRFGIRNPLPFAGFPSVRRS